MESFYYIIYSQKLDKFYIGFTQESVHQRLEKHRRGTYSSSFTHTADDWELFFEITCDCNSQALAIEKHIKSMKSRKYLENLKKYPEITEKLKKLYKCT